MGNFRRDILLSCHRSHLDESQGIYKLKQALASELGGSSETDGPPIDVSTYADQMDAILAHEIELIQSFRKRLESHVSK